MSIKPSIYRLTVLESFEIDVILDEYQTPFYNPPNISLFEIDVILDEYQT